MPRPLKTDRPIKVTISLPESLYTRLMLHLMSDVEGRVPHGAVSGFFERLAREALDKLNPPT